MKVSNIILVIIIVALAGVLLFAIVNGEPNIANGYEVYSTDEYEFNYTKGLKISYTDENVEFTKSRKLMLSANTQTLYGNFTFENLVDTTMALMGGKAIKTETTIDGHKAYTITHNDNSVIQLLVENGNKVYVITATEKGELYNMVEKSFKIK